MPLRYLVVVAICLLTACGGDDNDESSSENSAQDTITSFEWAHSKSLDETITGGHTDVQGLDIAINSNGDGIAVWFVGNYWGNGGFQVFKNEYIDGSWQGIESVSNEGISVLGEDTMGPYVALSDNGDAVIIWGQAHNNADILFMSEKRDGVWTSHTGLAEAYTQAYSTFDFQPKVVMGADGETVITWSDGYNLFGREFRGNTWENIGSSNDFPWIAENIRDYDLDMSPNGDTLITYVESGVLYTSEYRNETWTHTDGYY